MLHLKAMRRLTRDDVTRVHCVLVLNEAKAVHELDLGDFTGAMSLEVGLDFGLGGIARKVAQVQAGGRDFGHGGVAGGFKPMDNLAWKGGERMLTVNECLGMDAAEVCQKRDRCRQEEHGSREPVARMTRYKGARETPGSFQRAQYNSGWSYLGDVRWVALELLSQDGRLEGT
jgi:hypothetical protein